MTEKTAASAPHAPSSKRLEPLKPRRCRRPQHRLLRGRSRRRAGRDADARLPLRHSFLCRRRAATGGPRLPRHRPLSARLRADPVSRFRDTALGRAGGGRRRHDGADGRAWDQARGVRRLRLGWPRGLRRRGAMAGALHRARLRQFLSDPGYRQRDGAAARRARGRAVVPVLLPARTRPRGTGRQPARDRQDIVDAMVAELAVRRCLFRADGDSPSTIPTTSMW